MQVVYSFISHVPVTAQPAENASYPKSKLAKIRFPLRHSRSTGIGSDQYYVLDLGANYSTTIWISIADANYTAIKIAAGTSATYNDGSFTANETSHTLLLDNWTNRYKGVFSHTFSTQRYLRYRIPAQTPIISPLTVFNTGVLYVYTGANLITLTKQFSDPASVKIKSDYRSTRFGISRENVFYLTFDANVGAITSADLSEWQQLAFIGADSPFLLHFNRGNIQEVFPMLYLPDIGLTIKGVEFGASLQFQEITFGR